MKKQSYYNYLRICGLIATIMMSACGSYSLEEESEGATSSKGYQMSLNVRSNSGDTEQYYPLTVFLFNEEGELYLQKRPAWKDIQPDKWDTAVGGHVDLGESIDIALRREAKEELGITDFIPTRLEPYIFESACEKEFVFPFKTVYNGQIKPSKELDGGRFWRREEIQNNLGKNIFTPNFESEFKRHNF